MKIFIVCSRLCYGGAEHVAVMWANGFVERGFDVVLVSDTYDNITYSISDRVTICQLYPRTRYKVWKWLGAVRLLRKYVSNGRADVIIGVMSTCSLVSQIASLGMDIPVVASEHNAFERPTVAPFSLWEKFAKFSLNKLYDAITVLTKADNMCIGDRLNRVFVMPNPLALPPVSSIPHKENVVLAAGRMDAWQCKGFDVLIKAWGIILNKEDYGMIHQDWRLQIAGVGSEVALNYLKQLSMENNVVNNVDFLGFVNDMQTLYQRSSIFVLSSRYEGFGLVLIEAMSQGCACVACDYKGRQREIIQNDSQGLCCEPENVEALASALKKMMEDDNYRESVRTHAIERSKYYSIDAVIDRWEDLLGKVVGKEIA